MITQEDLFRRSFRLTVANKQFVELDGLRPITFSFSVQRDKTITPNNASVTITNLNPESRALLEELTGGFGQGTATAPKRKLTSKVTKAKKTTKKAPSVPQAPADADGIVVRLEAGYQDRVGQIFFGVLRKCSSWKQGTEWLTQISGGDSEHSITTSKISRSFVAGTPITSVVRALVESLGVGEGGLSATLADLERSGFLAGGRTLSKALALHGDSATALERLMRSCGYEWSIQDGQFWAGPVGEPTMPGEGPLLTPATGLLDTPQIDKNGRVVGRALLNPDLLPGRVFRVESRRVSGNFICEKTQHAGVSTGDQWEVQFVGSPPEPGSKAALLAAALGDTGFRNSASR